MKQWFDKDNRVRNILNKYKEELDFKSKNYEEVISLLDKPIVVSLKIDGEINAIYFDGEETYLVSLAGRIRTDLPLTNEITQILKSKKFKELVAFGELYVIDENEKPIKYSEGVSILRNPQSPQDEERIRMIVFGIYEIDNKRVEEEDYWKEFILIEKIFKDGEYVKPAVSRLGRKEDVKEFWKKVLKGEAEGLVIHEDDVVKIKPVFTQDLVVIGVELSKKHPDRVGSLLLAYMPQKDEFRYAGSVGGGLKEKERYELLEEALKHRVEGPKKIRVIWVNPYTFNKIVEVASDTILRHSTPTYKFDGEKYVQIGEKDSAVGLKPRIVRWRDDKEITPYNLRLEQIPNIEKHSSLEEYKKKRDFDETPEPKPNINTEVDGKEGVLKSFVTRKIPNIGEKTLAIQTEDHPADYITFEGKILEGYGAGKIEIIEEFNFDIIEWRNEKIKLRIKDNKNLEGIYTLVKMKKDEWLMYRGPIEKTVTSSLKPGTEEDIVIPPNEYYPNGLTKKDIYDYYVSVYDKLLKYLKGRKVFVILNIDGTILKRKEGDQYLTIESKEDLEKLNTGRTTEFHIVADRLTDIGWIDLDPKEEFNLKKAKEIALNLVPLIKENFKIKDLIVKFSGHRGYHILFWLKSKIDVDELRKQLKDLLEKYIDENELKNVTTSITHEKNSLRLDVSTLHETGGIRAPYSLHSKTGLISYLMIGG